MLIVPTTLALFVRSPAGLRNLSFAERLGMLMDVHMGPLGVHGWPSDLPEGGAVRIALRIIFPLVVLIGMFVRGRLLGNALVALGVGLWLAVGVFLWGCQYV
jgi:hypothetical protein